MQILSQYEREQITWYLKLKLGPRAIGRKLKRSHSVVVRELKRNGWPKKPYRPDLAQSRAERLARHTNIRKLQANERLRAYVVRRLQAGWSPEQISGRLKVHPPPEFRGQGVSHETIYQYIYANDEPWEKLYCYLRRRGKQRQPRYTRKKRKAAILERISIHERPTAANERERYGDWETDTMKFGRKPGGLSVQYERKSLLVRAHLISRSTAEDTREAIRQSVESLPHKLWQSLTWDNGSEGTCHRDVRDEYGIATYFCDPYAAWQKGGVENLNGLLRLYLPKSLNPSILTPEYVYRVQETLNNRPRKKLNYQTPNEVITQILTTTGALNP
jgi:IS30 family transposase